MGLMQRRVFAAVSDAVELGIVWVLWSWVMTMVIPLDVILPKLGVAKSVAVASAWGSVVLLPIATLGIYASLHSGSHGMRKAGLLYANADGQPLSAWRAVLRYAVGVATLPVFPLSIVMAVVGQEGRTLADVICGTRVIVMGVRPEGMK